MRNILAIARDDLHRVRTNVMASIFMVVLVSIPLLFTWFNVLATWNPFSNSDNLKIAVANTDQGYTTDVLNFNVNVGDIVLKELSTNDSLDWVITDEAGALEGTRSGEYYAAIVLPEDFSTSMFTFYAGGAEPADISLYTNEKKNALSANISRQGAQGVTTQINTAFTQVLADVALGLAQNVTGVLDDDNTAATLDRLNNRLESLSAQLRTGATTVESISSLVDSSLPLVQSASELAASLRQSLPEAAVAPATEQPLPTDLSDSLGAAAESIGAVQQQLDTVLNSTDTAAAAQAQALESTAKAIERQVAGFRTLREGLPDTPVLGDVDRAIARQEALVRNLEDTAADLRAGVSDRQQARERSTQAVQDAEQAIATARDNFRTNLEPQLEQLRDNVASAQDNLGVMRSYLDEINTQLGTSAQGMSGNLAQIRDALQTAADDMRAGATRVEDTIDALNAARTDGDFERVAEIIGSSPQDLAQLIAQPVDVDRQAVFPVAGFGVGMTPLFSMIALWVGALLAAAFLRTDLSPAVYQRLVPRRLTHLQEYFGRYLIFWLVGMAQSTLLMLGLIVFVEISPAHPFLLVVAGWVISTVFSLIIYTLVLALANAGKAVAVVLLVFQISAAGGAYPLEVLPHWFQSISPWLPATYAINMMRAAVAGIYEWDYLRNMGMLLLFVIPTLLIGLVLRHAISKRIGEMVAALESTKLM